MVTFVAGRMARDVAYRFVCGPDYSKTVLFYDV